jgi:hypothetical protein
MKIYLGKLDETRETTDAFESPNGTFYDFEIEVLPDMIRIKDSVGRVMPIDSATIGDFAEMLGRIHRMNTGIVSANEFLKWELMNVNLGNE